MAVESSLRAAREAWTRRDVDGRAYLRLPVRTRWLIEGEDLVQALRDYLPRLQSNDTVVVSEKVAILLTGRAIPVTAVRPGRLARALARRVRPPEGSYGLSVPEKMQYVVQSVGAARLIVAASVSALTRPLGFHGAFYRVAGPIARDVDGALPPYQDVLFHRSRRRSRRRSVTASRTRWGSAWASSTSTTSAAGFAQCHRVRCRPSSWRGCSPTTQCGRG
jgi:hypothetical protein